MLRFLRRWLGGGGTAARETLGRGTQRDSSLTTDARAVAQLPAEPRRAPRPPPHAGPFAISVVDSLHLWDAGRARLVEVRIVFPTAGKDAHPLIVFSHGARGSKDDYQLLTQCWASWGFVCIQPNHSDAQAVQDLEPSQMPASTFKDWPNRPRDVSFILDSLIDLEHRTPGLAGRIDRERIGVGGHSFGASTAQLLGGALVIRDQRRSRPYRDPRVKALALISPQGRGQLHDDGSWDELKVPTLTVTGTRDRGRDGQGWQWRLEPFHGAPAGAQYAVVIQDGTHAMGGLDRASPHLPSLHEPDHAQFVFESSLQFWNAWLKGRSADRASLGQPRELRQGTATAQLLVR
ncbi:MAG: hypothetical protein AAFX85_15125 [Pseudomonadota bacterium]